MTLQQPPGWYRMPDGSQRWWDGRTWTVPAARALPSASTPPAAIVRHPQLLPPGAAAPWQAPTVVHHVHVSQKEVGTAYLFAILLAGFAAHRFYLGKPGSAIAMLLLWQVGVATAWLGIGLLLGLAFLIWWIVDLCTLRGMVEQENARRFAAAAAPPRHVPR